MNLKLNLESIRIHKTLHKTDDGTFGGGSEWRLNIIVANQHLDWDKNGVNTGETFTINKDFIFDGWDPNHDLTIKFGGIEKDKGPDDRLPSVEKTFGPGDFHNHSFQVPAAGGGFAYETTWHMTVT
jgi:hypothetical protein